MCFRSDMLIQSGGCFRSDMLIWSGGVSGVTG